MPRQKSPGSPTTRRYSESEMDQAVRLVRQLRVELGTDHGTVYRVARQLGYGVESVRAWVRDRDVADGVAGPDAQRVRELQQPTKELEQELRETRRANEILPRPLPTRRRHQGRPPSLRCSIRRTRLDDLTSTAPAPIGRTNRPNNATVPSATLPQSTSAEPGGSFLPPFLPVPPG